MRFSLKKELIFCVISKKNVALSFRKLILWNRIYMTFCSLFKENVTSFFSPFSNFLPKFLLVQFTRTKEFSFSERTWVCFLIYAMTPLFFFFWRFLHFYKNWSPKKKYLDLYYNMKNALFSGCCWEEEIY